MSPGQQKGTSRGQRAEPYLGYHAVPPGSGKSGSRVDKLLFLFIFAAPAKLLSPKLVSQRYRMHDPRSICPLRSLFAFC